MPFYHDVNEWYPVLGLVSDAKMSYDDGARAAEFSPEEIARINKAFEDFRAAQKLISERFGLAYNLDLMDLVKWRTT